MTGVEQWLAREVVGAVHLLSIAHGDPEQARSALTASAAGSLQANGVRWCIDAGKVEYRHPGHGQGLVPVKALVKLAAQARTDDGSARLQSAYRAYVETSVEGRRYPLWPKPTAERIAEHEEWFGRYCAASSALEAARRGWWPPLVERYVQIDLFEETA
ncbi:hypothetical protein [Actinomycetospora termitidis]|uniref:Uncharacterized protein n=1 Tax=Actinomycetospora termitidis TaxID=3053470 RepID=A0ABT7MFK8_9PSEU|nr:hypothetical protein [Actinomycetospora sp. Odt1-22]MDL5159460.1 hypothetical protein [Actinomycetospora sp. Odt1-22]